MEQLRTQVAQDLRGIKRLVLTVATVAVILILAGGWSLDYRSCLRQDPGRQAAQIDAQAARQSQTYWATHGRPELARIANRRAQALTREKPLACFALLPGA